MGQAAAAIEWDFRGAAGADCGTAPALIESFQDARRKQNREKPSSRRDTTPRGFVYDGARCGRALRAGLSRRAACKGPLPMEETLLYVKEIDNSGVRRPGDPAAGVSWSRMVRRGVLALAAAALLFGPRAWLRESGYRVERMQQEKQELTEINRHLLVRQAQLSDLRRVGRLATARGLETPPPDRYAWQDLTIPALESEAAVAQSFVPAAPEPGMEGAVTE